MTAIPGGLQRPSTGRRLGRHLPLAAMLTLAWCALWGELSPANLLSGILVAAVLIAIGARVNRAPGRTNGGVAGGLSGLRLGPLLRLSGLVAADLAVSTATVAREVLTPIDHTDEAIVAVDLPPHCRRHLLLLVVGITVTPGTAVVDASPDGSTLYLHLLHSDRRESVVARVLQLAELAAAAFPAPSEKEPAR